MTAHHDSPLPRSTRQGSPISGRSRSAARAVRRALIPVIAAPVALSLTGCIQLPLGGQSGGAVSFDGVQSATIQIEAVGTFVDPSEGGYEAAGRGSGFLIDDSGIAVTNNHVVTGAGTIKVWRGGDTTEEIGAKVLGSSECLDLAVIELEGDGYPYLGWHKGDIGTATDVYAAGFPLGDPTFTMTRGIVSKASTDGETPWASIDNVIEHDARIRGGNSGGPLVDADGAVVGVNYAGNDELDYNYAIHRDEVTEAVKKMRKGEDVLSLGINGTAMMDEDGNGLGIWVNSVKSGSSADKAGVEPGDLLTRMEGVSLAVNGTMTEYCDVLRTHGQDATLSVELYRPAEEAYYRGQFNGDETLEPVSVIADATGTSDSSASAGGFVTVTDDSGVVVVDVPASWSQVDGSPFTDDAGNEYKGVQASTDLAGFQSSWNVPGVAIYASQQAVGTITPEALHESMTSSMGQDGCQQAATDAYDDGYHVGVYSYWTNCGGVGTDAVVVAADAADGSYVILLTAQATTEADIAALDRVLASFVALF
ncbi:S1C family serine protease [Agromyces bauzanensis]